MAIDGLILLDNTGLVGFHRVLSFVLTNQLSRPVIQSGFRSTSSAYPLIHIDAYNSALSKVSRPDDVDPVIYVSSYNIAESPSACCHVQCADMRFLCPISGNGMFFSSLLLGKLNRNKTSQWILCTDLHFCRLLSTSYTNTLATFLQRPYKITLMSYIRYENQKLHLLRHHKNPYSQLLEETLDSGGHPLTTSPNSLRDIVLPPSLLNKLLNVAGANINSAINSGSGLGAAGGAFSSPIPWRKAGLKYSSNEIYFDLVEELQAIVNKFALSYVLSTCADPEILL